MSQDLQIRAEDWERNWALASTDERMHALTALLVAVRDEALEEAAGVSEMMANGWRDVQGKPELYAPVAAVAWRIRALKVKP